MELIAMQGQREEVGTQTERRRQNHQQDVFS